MAVTFVVHRANMAWAIRAASRVLPQEEIRTEIFHAPDLPKKADVDCSFNMLIEQV